MRLLLQSVHPFLFRQFLYCPIIVFFKMMLPGIGMDTYIMILQYRIGSSKCFWFCKTSGQVQGTAEEMAPPEHRADRKYMILRKLPRVIKDQPGQAQVLFAS